MSRLRIPCNVLPLIGACVIVGSTTCLLVAQEDEGARPAQASKNSTSAAGDQAKLEAALVKMLSGATLEGSFTSTGAGSDSTRLSREKYTLGNVRKLAGNVWLIPARIQYGEHDVTLPVTVPIRWAGDTPVVVVDSVELPAFGAVSARVIFFDGHYAGYWKHGKSGGNLFGVIRPGEKPAETSAPAEKPAADSGSNLPGGEQPEQ